MFVSRFRSLVVFSSAIAAVLLGLVGGVTAASAAPTLPTLNIALTGKTGISVSGSEVSGAVNVVSTFTGKGQGSFALVRLNPNLPPQTAIQEGFQAVQSHHGDENALTAVGDSVIASAQAPGSIQTVIEPGAYLALNVTGMGTPAFKMFNVTQSPSPAPLPAAKAKQTAIEFGFRGPTTLHTGTMVRAQNGGYLVHMIDLLGVKSKADGQIALAGLKAGKGQKFFRPLSNGVFVSLLDPASPGALQQTVLNAKPGWYVEACFMDTQDGREHVQVGMERLVHIVK
ncbi:MAG: hypothetical protein ACXVH3_34825 [Solirubrobacteraceae bacterium]